jgi:hypothetical protein
MKGRGIKGGRGGREKEGRGEGGILMLKMTPNFHIHNYFNPCRQVN